MSGLLRFLLTELDLFLLLFDLLVDLSLFDLLTVLLDDALTFSLLTELLEGFLASSLLTLDGDGFRDTWEPFGGVLKILSFTIILSSLTLFSTAALSSIGTGD